MLKSEVAGLGGGVLQAAKILWELAKQFSTRAELPESDMWS